MAASHAGRMVVLSSHAKTADRAPTIVAALAGGDHRLSGHLLPHLPHQLLRDLLPMAASVDVRRRLILQPPLSTFVPATPSRCRLAAANRRRLHRHRFVVAAGEAADAMHRHHSDSEYGVLK